PHHAPRELMSRGYPLIRGTNVSKRILFSQDSLRMSSRCSCETSNDRISSSAISFPSTPATSSWGAFAGAGRALTVAKRPGKKSTAFLQVFAREAQRSKQRGTLPDEQPWVYGSRCASRAL